MKGRLRIATVHQWFTCLLAAGLITAHTLPAQAATTLYKWTDEDGTIHYSERPPTGQTEFEKVSSNYAPETPAPSQDTQPDGEENDTTEPSAAAPTQPEAEDPAVVAERCAKARKNLEALTSFARIRVQESNGEFRFLNQDEINQRKMETQALIEDDCDR